MKKQIALLTLCTVLFIGAHATPPSLSGLIYVNRSTADEGIKIKLTLGGKTYDVITYNLNYVATDKSKPNEAIPTSVGFPYNNIFNSLLVTIKSTKVDPQLMDWILSSDSNAKDGEIVILDADAGKVLKTITLTGLKPASYNENYYNNNSLNNIPIALSFSLHFTKVSIKM